MYEENDTMPLLVVSSPAEGGRHYATETRQTGNVALRQKTQQETRNVDDVSDIDDLLHYNICALFCCFPIAFIGLIFSLLCQCPKSAGKRKLATCLSVTASVLFTLSLFVFFMFFINVLHITNSVLFLGLTDIS